MAAALEDLRVVLLGKTGAGKSSTGNTLLDRNAFRVARGLSSGTEKCQWADEEIVDLNVHLQVTDTPGVSDTHREEKDVLKEVAKSIALSSPGPHVILMVVRGDGRFTPEEFFAYTTLKQLFGDAVKNFMILVFVGIDSYDGDTLEDNRRMLTEMLQGASGHLKTVLDDAGGRVFGISNKASKPDKLRQGRDLIKMMMALKSQRDGKYYKSELSDKVKDLVSPMVQDRMAKGNVTEREAVRQTNVDIVKESESSRKFLDTLEHKILPIIKQGVRLAIDIVGVVKTVRACAVM